MKNKNTNRKKHLSQLLSGTIYTALAAVVVAVSLNATVGILSKNDVEIPDIDNAAGEKTPQSITLPQFEMPDLLPQLQSDSGISDTQSTFPASDTADGISADITEDVSPGSSLLSDSAASPTPEVPEGASLGFDKFIKPCDGYVSKEHSVEIPVYSTTLDDYRVHIGVDVTGEVGTPVVAVIGGVVTDVYTDDLYGRTVCIKSRDGYNVKYSNLFETLNAGICVGALVSTGQTLGSIGDTALCEALEPSHLHLEIYDSMGNAQNPEDLISF